jgi:hypothetical protein
VTYPRFIVALSIAFAGCLSPTTQADPKVEEQVVGPAGRADFKYTISKQGLHLASVIMKGSRFAVVVDGVEGPQVDEVYATAPRFQDLPDLYGDLTQHAVAGVSVVAFSPDGARHAYAARQSKDVVLIVDGKETFRAPYSPSRPAVDFLSFSPDGKHVYFQTPTTDTMYSSCLVMDGQRGPAFAEPVWPVFSPDGAHWAYYAKRPTPGLEAFTVVDGKPADYHAGRLRYTPDGKHLVGVGRNADGKQAILVDGKVVEPLGQVERIAVSSTGDVAAVVLVGQTRQVYVNGKAVPGTEGAYGAVFSPDGKRLGVRCGGGSPPQGWQVIDGKKGREYSSVGDCVFTADSSKAIYVADVQNTRFVVIDGQEAGPYQSMLTPPTVSAAGAHFAYVAATQQGRQLVVNDKAYPPGRDVDAFVFSADGSRHAFLASLDLAARSLVVDGKQYNNVAVMPGTPVLISADGKHVAAVATPPGARAPAIMIDEAFIPLPASADGAKLCGFTPDGNHLFWRCNQRQKDGSTTKDVYLDGRRVASFDAMMVGLPQDLTDLAADGTFAVLGGAGGTAIKRVRVTASADTSLASWAADVKAEQEKAIAAAAQKAADDKAAAEKAAADAKAAREKAIADKKAAQEKAIADKKAAQAKLAADRKAAAEKAAADKAAKRAGKPPQQ